MSHDIWSAVAATMVGICIGAAIMVRGKSIAWNVAAVNAVLLRARVRGWL